ncbi:hypothetical protein B9Z55_026783 [Caenorhabditis nigoni]|uniref:Nuclear receptor domain-containing protein n=1 Tax=Caenorhabditis nigoni TaxID=1611254 RepID=A0A2G5SHE3_9PELO|nr:hypothetical protein B9Z55_026783 [Caenorhabditis nigoni]
MYMVIKLNPENDVVELKEFLDQGKFRYVETSNLQELYEKCDTEFNNTNDGNIELDLSDMPMFGNDAFYNYNEESASGEEQSRGKEKGGNKKSTRKRANTTSSNGGTDKTKSKRTANKVCRVCGDKAISCNFNVITCESCKAFFRRNAIKEKEHRCPLNDQCEITMVSRRFCQRCRLTKCFSKITVSDIEKYVKFTFEHFAIAAHGNHFKVPYSDEIHQIA